MQFLTHCIQIAGQGAVWCNSACVSLQLKRKTEVKKRRKWVLFSIYASSFKPLSSNRLLLYSIKYLADITHCTLLEWKTEVFSHPSDRHGKLSWLAWSTSCVCCTKLATSECTTYVSTCFLQSSGNHCIFVSLTGFLCIHFSGWWFLWNYWVEDESFPTTTKLMSWGFQLCILFSFIEMWPWPPWVIRQNNGTY